MKTMSKILATILIVVLCVSLFTVQAFADGHDATHDAGGYTSVAEKASTCKEQGWDAYSVCNTCGQLFDSSGNWINAIPYRALSTTHDLETVAEVAATCTTSGTKAYKVCKVCGKMFDSSDAEISAPEAIPATGHTAGTVAAEKPATCYSTGVKKHSNCKDCGALLDESGTPTTLAALTIPIDQNAHNWVKDTTKSIEATETHSGRTVYVCSVCGAEKVENIPAASGVTANPVGSDIYPIIAARDTWYRGEELPMFTSELIRELNAASGSKSNYVGVRIGTDQSLYANSYATLDFWSSGSTITLGEAMLRNLDAGTYYLWVYDVTNPNRHTNSIAFYIVDVPTLEPINTDKHVINSTKNLRFRASEPITAESVKVGGKSLYDPNYYYVSNDGLTITLSPDFLNERQAGTYTISANTRAGGVKVSCPFYILSSGSASSASPKTADESQLGLWAAFLLLSGAAVVVLIPKIRKHGA